MRLRSIVPSSKPIGLVDVILPEPSGARRSGGAAPVGSVRALSLASAFLLLAVVLGGACSADGVSPESLDGPADATRRADASGTVADAAGADADIEDGVPA